MSVIIDNRNPNAQVSAEEGRTSSGQRQLDVVVDEITSRNLRRAGSGSNLAVRESLGGRQSLVAR